MVITREQYVHAAQRARSAVANRQNPFDIVDAVLLELGIVVTD